jgi:MFS family permease
MLPMLIGVIGSSIASGQIVSRTGRYKWLMAGALLLAGIGLFLLTGLRSNTPIAELWFWMFVMGLGIGPSMAVFTIIIQNSVPFRVMGVATSSLIFFRQVGGSIGLAIAGTIFGSNLTAEIPRQMSANGVPQQLIDGFQRAGLAGGSDTTAVGVDLGQQILSRTPAQFQPLVQQYIDAIVNGVYQAFSIAVANAMWLGVITAVVAFVIVAVFIPEVPLRHHAEEGTPEKAAADGPAPVAAFH